MAGQHCTAHFVSFLEYNHTRIKLQVIAVLEWTQTGIIRVGWRTSQHVSIDHLQVTYSLSLSFTSFPLLTTPIISPSLVPLCIFLFLLCIPLRPAHFNRRFGLYSCLFIRLNRSKRRPAVFLTVIIIYSIF